MSFFKLKIGIIKLINSFESGRTRKGLDAVNVACKMRQSIRRHLSILFEYLSATGGYF